jgi:curved DNA-binding protein
MSAATPKLTIAEARVLLGIAAEAGLEEAARAFRAAAKRAHPDRPGGDAAHFRDIVAAYRTLQSVPPLPAVIASAPAGAPNGAYVEISARVALEGGEAEAVLEDGRKVRARIPPGARAGERLRIAGGWRVTVRIAPDDAVQVRGSDLWVTAQAPAMLLVESGRATLATPLGARTCWITRKAAERRLVRLEGQGLPARGEHPQGDLFVRLEPDDDVPAESPARAQLKKFAAAWAA